MELTPRNTDNDKLLEALKRREQIMKKSYKQTISVGDYVKVINTDSKFYNQIGRVVTRNTIYDYVITDFSLGKQIPIGDVEKYY